MTEKNIFAYKLFFVIKYFRFSFIFDVKFATPLKKVTPHSQQPLLKVEALSKTPPPPPPTLLENLVGDSTSPSFPTPAEKGERAGAHYGLAKLLRSLQTGACNIKQI